MSAPIALIGFGKMGIGMAKRLCEAGLDVRGWDPDAARQAEATELGVKVGSGLADVVAGLPAGGIVWVMVPAGSATRAVLGEVANATQLRLIVVDGGNSNFADAADHDATFAAKASDFVDVGVSGGQWGWKTGYGLMVGASESVYAELAHVLDALAGPGAHSRVGNCGAGHLVKALHNGVQYALMQAYAEGFSLLEAHAEVDTVRAMSAWQNGSSVRSYLLEQMLAALVENPTLDGVEPVVPDSGMGRWTAEEAIRTGTPTPVLTTALYARFHSQNNEAAERLLRASRSQIGGQK